MPFVQPSELGVKRFSNPARAGVPGTTSHYPASLDHPQKHGDDGHHEEEVKESPIVYELTMPSNHITSNTTTNVSSMSDLRSIERSSIRATRQSTA